MGNMHVVGAEIKPVPEYNMSNLPKEKFWLGDKYNSPVRRQKCGDCWAQATTAVVESRYAIKYNTKPPNISVQELIDCTWDHKNGCSGGNDGAGYRTMDQFGIRSEKDYPYVARASDFTCKRGNKKAVVKNIDWWCIRPSYPNLLKATL